MSTAIAIIIVGGQEQAAGITVRGPDGEEPRALLAEVAQRAILDAWDRAGGAPYTTDGDTYLDLEGVAGDIELALGIILCHLIGAGFAVRVEESPPEPDT